MRLGVTGHQKIKIPYAWHWARQEIDRVLDEFGNTVVGLTSLAAGADQIFAELVLNHGGELEVVVPFPGYELIFSRRQDRKKYDNLMVSASSVEILERVGSDEQCYMNAGKRIVDLSDLVLAVWNGTSAAGLGGTGDVVRYALLSGKRVVHLNPITRHVQTLDDQVPEYGLEHRRS